MDISTLKTKAQMAELIVRLDQAEAGWHAPLLRAAMNNELRMLLVPPGSRLPLSLLDMRRHPRALVVILGGDNDTPAGPADFPQARRLVRWSRFNMLHSTGGQPFHYEIAADAARRIGRVVIAETATARLDDWLAFMLANAPATPFLIVAPPEGGYHPNEAVPAGVVVQ